MFTRAAGRARSLMQRWAVPGICMSIRVLIVVPASFDLLDQVACLIIVKQC